MVFSCACFAGMSAMIRHVSAELSPFEITFFRNLFALLAVLPLAFRARAAVFGTRRLGLHLARAGIGIGAMWCWYYALSLAPLAEAIALNFTVALFAIPAAILILGERVGRRRWAATVVGFAGALVILRPGAEALSTGGGLALGAAALFALAMTLIKLLSRTEPPSVIVFYMNALMTPLSLVPALIVWKMPSPEAFGWLAAVGAVATAAHLSLARAFRDAEATLIVPFDFTRLPFAALIGYFAFGEVPGAWTWLGAAIIVASTVYIAHREARTRAPAGPADRE